MINLEGIEDEEFKKDLSQKAVAIFKEVEKTVAKVKALMYKQLKIEL